MDLGLNQRVALVTGASSGLGLAIARALAAEGCAVAMVARRREVLEREARDILAESKGRALPLVADVTRPDDVGHVTSQAAALLGPIDILVANAGGPPSTTFTTTTEEQLQSALELNLLSSIRLTRAVLPGMRERRWGRVIFVSSMAAKQPLGGLLLSNTARAGLLGFAKTIANECAPDNVLVNTVLPGHFDTDRAMELAKMRSAREGRPVEEILRNRSSSIPLGRSGRPEEFAAAVAFLASERASFITGVALQIDGGQIAGLI
jgi:3-oxoacyl-[acyl-carrier protein] reductase